MQSVKSSAVTQSVACYFGVVESDVKRKIDGDENSGARKENST